MKNVKKLIAGVAALAAVQMASATMINGEISFSGQVTLDGSTQTATEILSFDSVTVTPGTQAGDYVGLGGLSATMNGFQFDPVLSPSPVLLWEVNDGGNQYSFYVEAITGVERFTSGGNNFLTIAGRGTATGTGFDDNSGGVWAFTTQATGGQSTLSFSSTTAVPDGGATAALLGLGLIGLAAASRRFRKA